MPIRDATEADLPAILAITNAVIATSTAIFSAEAMTLADRRDWFRGRAAQGFPILAAEEACEVVGFATYGAFRGGPGYRHTVEHSVHVREDRRGNGLGSALVAALFPRAAAAGLHVMVAGIDAANAGSIRMHERLGFTRTGLMPGVGRKFGRWLDLALLQREV